MTDFVMGPVESQVRRDVEALITEHPMGEALAELTFSLAAALDGQVGGMARAALSRELRQTLIELAGLGVDDDDLGVQLSNPVLPPEIRHPEEP